MGGFASIPTVQTTVPTPSLPPRPRAPLLEEPRVTPILREGAEDLGQLGKVLAVQQAHKNILDADAAEEDFKNQIGNIYAQAKTLPGDQWASTVQKQGNDAMQKMLQDPNNQHISPYLQKRLPQLLGLTYHDALFGGATQTAKDQHEQWKYASGRMAAEAAGSYDPNTFQDGDQAQAISKKINAQVDQMWPNNPQAAGLYRQEFEDAKIQERGQWIARNAPTQLGDYLNAQSAKFSPEKQGQLMTVATQAIDLPMKQIDANANAARASAIQYQQNYIKQNGRPDMARLQHDTQFQVIKAEDFQRFSGQQYENPTPPATLANYKNQITNAADVDELEEIKANVRGAAAFKNMNGGDVPTLEESADARIRQFKTDAGQEIKTGKGEIRKAYQNLGQPAFLYGKLAAIKGMPSLTQLQKNAEDDFEASIAATPTDRTKIHDAWQKAIEENKPDFEGAGIKIPAAPTTLPPMSDEAKIALGKKLGIIH